MGGTKRFPYFVMKINLTTSEGEAFSLYRVAVRRPMGVLHAFSRPLTREEAIIQARNSNGMFLSLGITAL